MNPIGLVPELYCSNLTETLNFYTQILGFQILFERKEERFAYLQKGNAQIMIEELGAGRQWITAELQKPFGRGINFQIEIDDIEALHQTAVKHGLAFVLPLEDKWYQQKDRTVGNRQFAIQDPDGYLLRFYKNLTDHPLHQ